MQCSLLKNQAVTCLLSGEIACFIFCYVGGVNLLVYLNMSLYEPLSGPEEATGETFLLAQ